MLAVILPSNMIHFFLNLLHFLIFFHFILIFRKNPWIHIAIHKFCHVLIDANEIMNSMFQNLSFNFHRFRNQSWLSLNHNSSSWLDICLPINFDVVIVAENEIVSIIPLMKNLDVFVFSHMHYDFLVSYDRWLEFDCLISVFRFELNVGS